MVKRLVFLAISIALVLSFGACKKKEQAPPTQGMHPGQGAPQVVMQGEPQIVIPDNIKGKWSSVVLIVTDKTTNKSQEVKVGIGSETALPNTPLKVKVVDYLPDFKMQENKITSVSNEPNNPAAKVQIAQAGKEPWDGWLFSNMPQVHAFAHEKYGVILKEGVKK